MNQGYITSRNAFIYQKAPHKRHLK